MKNLFVFLTAILLHANNLSAQTPANPLTLSGKIGLQSQTLEDYADIKLPGETDALLSTTLGLDVQLQVSKRVSFYAAYSQESASITKTTGRLEFSSGSLLGNILLSPIVGVLELFVDAPPEFTYTAKTKMQHVQLGGRLNWYSKPKVRLYTGLGAGLVSGNVVYDAKDGSHFEEKIPTSVRPAIVPVGLSVGQKVKFDISLGMFDAPAVSFGLGVGF